MEFLLINSYAFSCLDVDDRRFQYFFFYYMLVLFYYIYLSASSVSYSLHIIFLSDFFFHSFQS